jgi:hypothetical protein
MNEIIDYTEKGKKREKEEEAITHAYILPARELFAVNFD